MDSKTIYSDGSAVSTTAGPLQDAQDITDFGIHLIELGDWMTPLILAIQGYTIILRECDTLDEACAWLIAYRNAGWDVKMYGHDWMGYFIVTRKVR